MPCLRRGLAPVPGRAQFFISGSQLATACASRAVADERSCSGYIAGALDEVVANAELKATVCPPANVKLGALRDAVAKFGKDKPDEGQGLGRGAPPRDAQGHLSLRQVTRLSFR